jgi:protein-L-isoaspartate O-methyltransferase
MVRRHLAARGVRDERVLSAMFEVPREAFVPDALGDGSRGWRGAAPFDAIQVAAASPSVPRGL